jgi:hypothetical protein
MRSLRFIAAGLGVIVLGAWVTLAACGPDPTTGFIDVNDVPDGGVLVYPLMVTCGAGALCDLQASTGCCTGPGIAAPTCLDAGATCPASAGLATCNEEADCPVGTRCCASLFAGSDGGPGYLSAACAASCPAPEIQLCRTNGECSGDRCVIQTCPDKQKYEMCGLSTSAAFPCSTSGGTPTGGDE